MMALGQLRRKHRAISRAVAVACQLSVQAKTERPSNRRVHATFCNQTADDQLAYRGSFEHLEQGTILEGVAMGLLEEKVARSGSHGWMDSPTVSAPSKPAPIDSAVLRVSDDTLNRPRAIEQVPNRLEQGCAIVQRPRKLEHCGLHVKN
jgi:hypothetical protein